MIPTFPQFKKIEVSDREFVESHTRNYSPYSDFNFTSMYSWNVDDKMMLSELNGNLVVCFTDYITSQPFYSFLGTKMLDKTANALIHLSIRDDFGSALKLIPSIIAENLSSYDFDVEENTDQADYITSVYRLYTYSGRELAAKRRQHSLFSRRHTDFIFRELNLADKKIREDIRNLFSIWLTNKSKDLSMEEEHEFVALQRCLNICFETFIATGIFIDGSLVAFWILEDLKNGYAISHFEKADLGRYIGIFPFLKQKTAEILRKHDLVYVNLEQDLGIPGLRTSKKSYYPQHYLKKYTITLHS